MCGGRYKTPAEVTAEGRGHELEQQVATIEAMWGMKFPAGNDSELTCMAHLWEVRCCCCRLWASGAEGPQVLAWSSHAHDILFHVHWASSIVLCCTWVASGSLLVQWLHPVGTVAGVWCIC